MTGGKVRLKQVADVYLSDGRFLISHEGGIRRVAVTCNVRGRDVESFVAEAERKLKEQVQMPSPRYHTELGGQYEHLIGARRRLMLVVPLALVPALVLWGERDQFFPVETIARPLADLLGADLHVFPGGHFLPLDAPEPVSSALCALLVQKRD